MSLADDIFNAHVTVTLTEREREVLRLMAAGRTNREIATQLFMTVGTVRWYSKQIYAKLGVHTHTQAVLLAEKLGLTAVAPTASPPVDHLPAPTTPDVLARPQTSWGYVPIVNNLYGRASELASLRQWIVDERCRLVAVRAMSGQGKTALTITFARSVESDFDCVIWRSLLNAPPLNELLQGWLRLLSGKQPAIVPDRLDAQLDLLFEILGEYRCLLVLDNAESIMGSGEYGGEYLPGCETYGQLLRRFGESEHQSCLLLTSRETPAQFRWLERNGALVRTLKLAGLDAVSGQALMQQQGLSGAGRDMAELVSRYSGNPLALKLVADTIRELHNGDIGAFLAHETPIFADIRDILEQQFNRLSALEETVMLWLAIERVSTSIETLRNNLVQPPAHGDLLAALQRLQRRSLIEKRGDGFGLHNIILEYVTNRLVERASQEMAEEQLAYVNRYALTKAESREYVRQSQMRLILERVAERLLDRFGRAGIATYFGRLLAALRRATTLAPGYAGGNLLNLMLHLQVDCQGCDFSGLAVWQVYASDEQLPQVNFDGADLRGTVFAETFSHVLTMAFSRDGQRLAACTIDGEVRVWQASDGRLKAVFAAPRETLSWLVLFSADGHSLIGSGPGASVRIWDIDSDRTQHVLRGHTGRIWTGALSPDGTTLATGSEDGTIRLWDVSSGHALATLTGHAAGIHGVAFSPDGRWLISGDWAGAARLWDVRSGDAILFPDGPAQSISAVAFSLDGRHAATGSVDTTVIVWDVAQAPAGGGIRQVTRLQGHSGEVCALAFSTDGTRLASGGRDRLTCVWDVVTFALRHVLVGHDSAVQCVAFNPAADMLASGGWDKSVCFWNATTGHMLRRLTGLTGGIRTLSFHPNGRELASCGENRAIWLWDVTRVPDLARQETLPPPRDLPAPRDLLAPRDLPAPRALRGHAAQVSAVTFSPDGRLLASSSDDQTIRLWDAASKELLKVIPSRIQGDPLHHDYGFLSISPDGTLVANGGYSNLVPVWDTRSGTLTDVFQGHTDTVSCVHFSPDGAWLVSGSADRTLRLWNVRSGQQERVFSGHSREIWDADISPDGRLLASIGGEDETIRIWDMQSGQVRQILTGHSASIHTVAFSPDGRLLASGGGDHIVRVWDAANGRVIHELAGHEQAVWSVAFHPQGTILASGGSDETIRFWDVRTGECLGMQKAPGPYAGMSVRGTTGLTPAQRASLAALGARL